MTIEVEVRAFISKTQFERLLGFMKQNANFLKKDNQLTLYLSGDKDLRLQKNNFFSKIWFKQGKIHDPHRKELEVRFEKNQFQTLKKLFLALGYSIDIKWLRKRNLFNWNGINVAIDYTKGYGYIIELEKLSSDKEKQAVYAMLKSKLAELNIKPTPKHVFDKRFNYYKENWKELIKSK